MDKNQQTIIGARPEPKPFVITGNWLMLFALPVLLSACGWVDSTGSGGADEDSVESQFSQLASVPAESNGATSDGANIIDLAAVVTLTIRLPPLRLPTLVLPLRLAICRLIVQ